MPKAVCLLSGGLDSATCLAIAQADGFDVHALSFDYGQRHTWELIAAKRVAQRAGISNHTIAKIDLRAFGGSALTSSDIAVPKGRDLQQMSHDIPVTYVPARNTIFLSFALALAETLSSSDIFIGVNALDYSGYPDCRPEYIHAYESMANLATKAGVQGKQNLKIHTPLIHLTKSQIIHRGLSLGVDYSLTSTCYDPSPTGLACAQCDACLLRLKGFAENGIPAPLRINPIPYEAARNLKEETMIPIGDLNRRYWITLLQTPGLRYSEGPDSAARISNPIPNRISANHRTLPKSLQC